jgi:hypothetical protein
VIPPLNLKGVPGDVPLAGIGVLSRPGHPPQPAAAAPFQGDPSAQPVLSETESSWRSEIDEAE